MKLMVACRAVVSLCLTVALALSLLPAPAAAQGIILPPPRCFDLPVPLPELVPEPIPDPRTLPMPAAGFAPAVDAGIAGVVQPQVAPPTSPPVRPIFPCWLTLRSHRVAVEIADQVATTRVDQVFVNETGRDLEGSYLFPLPDDAIVTSFSMFVDGEQITGEVLSRDAARRLYESIVRANRDPALLEFAGRGAFQARVFPVPAGGQRTIRLEYSQVLPQDSNTVRYVYPTAAERLSARPSQEAAFTVSIRSAQPLRSIYSPSHDVVVTRAGEQAATATWSSKGTNVAAPRAFELVYGVSPDPIGLSVLTTRPFNEDGYFLLLAAPSLQLAATSNVPKDVTLVFDTSGSMAGAKIDQGKAALRYVINRLEAQDRFNVVAFASTVNPYASAMQPASERDRALAFVDSLVATGGTNIDDALITALKASGGGGRPHTLIFITDGLPTVGPQRPEQIIANAKQAAGEGARPRVFSFGVGNDVNTILLDKLSADFGGTSAYVKSNDNLEEAISSFYAKVASPVLTDLALAFGGSGGGPDVYDVFPARLPDLYAGSQLVLTGRYRRPGTFDVTLRGAAAGQAQQFTLPGASFAAGPVKAQETLPRLWAGRKIGFLLAEIRSNGANKELVDEVVALATRYGIATPYTSIFVPEPTGPARPGVPQATPAALNTEQGRAQAADALTQGVAAAPASGAAAVQNSTGTNALQQSSSVQSAGAATVQTLGDKTFQLVDGVWNDVSSTHEPSPPEARQRIAFGSAAYFALLDDSRHPNIALYLSAGARVLFEMDGVWMEVTD